MRRGGFTLLELVFVIVIFGIMSKYGADILYKIYENYIYSNTYNSSLNKSEMAVIQIGNRLSYRIQDSTIARDNAGIIIPIEGNLTGATTLEWIGVDIDGWKGTTTVAPDWSGFIDLASPSTTATALNSPATSAIAGNNAIFFIGSNVDLSGNAFGWSGAVSNQDGAMHPVTVTADTLTPVDGNFSGKDVYEFYQLSKSAFAVKLEGTNLNLYSGYQPWSATAPRQMSDVTPTVIMENVSNFQFTSMGDILVIQVCVSDNNITGTGGYGVCKEKMVF